MTAKCNSVVYGFRNINNDKWYVGSSNYFPTRKSHHLADLAKQKHHSPKFQNAWNKYGPEAFEFSILEYVPIPEGMSKLDFKPILLAREDHWTAVYDACKNGYNVALKAGSCLGIKRSKEYCAYASERNRTRMAIKMADAVVAAEVKLQMGEMAQGFWDSLRKDPVAFEKHCAKLSGPKIQPPRSKEHQDKIASSNTGQTRTASTKQQMSDSAKASWDGRRGFPAPKEDVAKRQLGRDATKSAKRLITTCMGLSLYFVGEVFSKEIDSSLISIGKDLADQRRVQCMNNLNSSRTQLQESV